MKRIGWKQLTKRRTLGFAIMALGLTVLFLPIFAGEWVIAILGILLIAAGLFQVAETHRSADTTTSSLSYIASVVTILLGIVLVMSPSLVLSGLIMAVMIVFLADGGIKIFGAFKQTGPERWWNLGNGLFTVTLGLLLWFFLSATLGIVAIGVILGLRLLAEGWTMVFRPEKGFESPDFKPDTRQHPDGRLALEPSDTIKTMQDSASAKRYAGEQSEHFLVSDCARHFFRHSCPANRCAMVFYRLYFAVCRGCWRCGRRASCGDCADTAAADVVARGIASV